MVITLLTIFTFVEIIVLAFALAVSSTPEWKACELLLLGAAVLVARAYLQYMRGESELRRGAVSPARVRPTEKLREEPSVEDIARAIVQQALRRRPSVPLNP